MSMRIVAIVVAIGVGVLQPAFVPIVCAQAREGIAVHGHWVIDVRNADGTLASHHEFENALHPAGALFLARVMSRQYVWNAQSQPIWAVWLSGGGSPPWANDALITEADNFTAPAWAVKFYTLTVAQTGASVILSGSGTATSNGQISSVSTALFGTSNDGGFIPFSGTGVTPISLLAGQIVQVTVTLSFS